MKNILFLLILTPLFAIGLISCESKACDCLDAFDCVLRDEYDKCIGPSGPGKYPPSQISWEILQECEEEYNVDLPNISVVLKQLEFSSTINGTTEMERINAITERWQKECEN